MIVYLRQAQSIMTYITWIGLLQGILSWYDVFDSLVELLMDVHFKTGIINSLGCAVLENFSLSRDQREQLSKLSPGT